MYRSERASAARAGPVAAVEGEEPRVQRLESPRAARAGQLFAENPRIAAVVDDAEASAPQGQRTGDHRLQIGAACSTRLEPADDGIDVFAPVDDLRLDKVTAGYFEDYLLFTSLKASFSAVDGRTLGLSLSQPYWIDAEYALAERHGELPNGGSKAAGAWEKFLTSHSRAEVMPSSSRTVGLRYSESPCPMEAAHHD